MNSVFINSIGTATPDYFLTQEASLNFMKFYLNLDSKEQRLLTILYKQSKIAKRHTVLPDYLLDKFDLFDSQKSSNPTTSLRMKLYKKEAPILAFMAIRNCINKKDLNKITHISTVSCTGMYAPGLDLDIIKEFNLNYSIKRTNINFMGCFAAINALRTANDICKADPSSKVLIVCIELCTLHFQQEKTVDNFLANALFADGAAAVLVSTEPSKKSFKLSSFECRVAPEGEKDMAWEVKDFGFEMVLTSYVHKLIKSQIRYFVEDVLKAFNLKTNEIDYFAVHPGGSKILKAFEQGLELNTNDLQHSYNILNDFGNMSSVTLLFVLDSIRKSLEPSDHLKNILGVAFGPGLTIETTLLQTHVQI